MSSGFWITLLIFAFVIGSIMALKPSAKQKALGKLRERGRVLGLQPKLVPCPDWLINARGEKGKGMVALYGLVIKDAKLPLSNALVIDNIIEVIEGDIALNDDTCGVFDALGITMQANFIGIYIKESLGAPAEMKPEKIEERLNNLKENLQMWAKKVQA